MSEQKETYSRSELEFVMLVMLEELKRSEEEKLTLLSKTGGRAQSGDVTLTLTVSHTEAQAILRLLERARRNG